MIKKLAILSFAIIISACNAPSTQTNLALEQNQINSSSKATEKNSLFGLNINTGSASLTSSTSTGDYQLTNSPSSVQIDVKRLGIKVHNSNHVNLNMPSSQFRGYLHIANDSGLYVEDYGKDMYYKIGTWSKKDKFKGKGYIDLKDKNYNLFTQSFDIKIDPIVTKVTADLPLNPMSHKYVYLEVSKDIKPVSKSNINFDLSKFIATK